MRIMLVGGGSGGHFYPLIAIAEVIRKRDLENSTTTELFYIGPQPYETDALAKLNIRYTHCPAGKQRRYSSLSNFFDLFRITFGILVATIKLYWLYPDVIMSKGSYTSVPVILAAAFLRIPIVIHESDAVAGRANKLAARFAKHIAISYEDAIQHFPAEKVALTGIPIRESFFVPAVDPRSALGISSPDPIILIMGGSLGSERINNLILDSLDELLPQFIIIHQTGPSHEAKVKQTAGALLRDQNLSARYFVQGHLPGNLMAAAQDAASVIVTRAGSTSIAEIALKGKPSILIPIPEEISHDQRTNAYAYARTGAASVLEEKNLTDSLLTAEITRIMSEQTVYDTMHGAAVNFTHKEAAYTLADTIINIAAKH